MRSVERFLVVDDDSWARAFICEALTAMGGETVQAANGAEALEKWDAGGITAVLTDHHMPMADGLTLVWSLRRRGFAGPVWVLSGGMSAELAEAYRALGVEAVLAKPIGLEELRAQVMTGRERLG
mgnify:CR=1 FL=1